MRLTGRAKQFLSLSLVRHYGSSAMGLDNVGQAALMSLAEMQFDQVQNTLTRLPFEFRSIMEHVRCCPPAPASCRHCDLTRIWPVGV